MPFVEVWVDAEPCDGTCDEAREAEQLKARIEEAVALLRTGSPRAALEALTDDEPRTLKTPNEIASRYKDWKNGLLPGFSNFRPQ